MILGFSSVLFLGMFLSQAEHVILNVSYFIMTAEKRSGSWHEHLINIHNVGRQQSSRENFKKINLICCLPWYTLAVCAEDKAVVQISLSKNKSQRLLGKKKVCLRDRKAIIQGKKMMPVWRTVEDVRKWGMETGHRSVVELLYIWKGYTYKILIWEY